MLLVETTFEILLVQSVVANTSLVLDTSLGNWVEWKCAYCKLDDDGHGSSNGCVLLIRLFGSFDVDSAEMALIFVNAIVEKWFGDVGGLYAR